MNRALKTLVGAQFLSAFGDNAVLFTVIAMMLQTHHQSAWYIPALQSSFLIAFIVLTPWVGTLADRYPKPSILFGANLFKILGTLSIYLGLEPIVGYAIIGMGAATYSPAKYGMLPDLAEASQLVKANAWVEGATIAAILLGTVGGARMADHSTSMALLTVMALYLVSGLLTRGLPRLEGPQGGIEGGSAWSQLMGWMKQLLKAPRAPSLLLALSLFWASGATLRVILIAWAPEVLGTQSASDIADLTFFLAIGIVIGAGIVPRLIPLEKIRRARFVTFVMGGLFILLAGIKTTLTAKIVLLSIGLCGGLFVVPLNAAVQAIGQRGIGSGRAVAAQNFFQNTAILISMGLYSLSVGLGVGSVAAIEALGMIVLIATVWISLKLSKNKLRPLKKK